MSQATHTPGEWVVGKSAGGLNTVIVHKDNKDAAHFHAIAFTVIRDGRTVKEIEANARLLAAAPKLLAACKLALEYFDNCVMECSPEDEDGECPEADALRAAIAKAENN